MEYSWTMGLVWYGMIGSGATLCARSLIEVPYYTDVVTNILSNDQPVMFRLPNWGPFAYGYTQLWIAGGRPFPYDWPVEPNVPV